MAIAKKKAAKKKSPAPKAKKAAPAAPGLGEVTQVTLGAGDRTHQRSVRKLDKKQASQIVKDFDSRRHIAYFLEAAEAVEEGEVHVLLVCAKTTDVWK